MLMDEPFSGLDKRLRDDIRDETLDILKSEETLFCWSHMNRRSMKMADEIALMRNGNCSERCSLQFYNAPVDKEAVAFFSDANIIKSKVRLLADSSCRFLRLDWTKAPM